MGQDGGAVTGVTVAGVGFFTFFPFAILNRWIAVLMLSVDRVSWKKSTGRLEEKLPQRQGRILCLNTSV